MSKSCKWVVIAESVYTDLLRGLETNIGKPDTPKEIEEEAVVDHTQVASEEIVQEAVKAVEEETKKVEKEEEEVKPSFTNSAVQNLPPSFRQEGDRLFKHLSDSEGFRLGTNGEIYIHGNLIPDFFFENLLRTLCIPFHKGVIPQVIQAFLKEVGLTKFRNHLVKLKPVWEKRYSWRKSTMETRQGHAEAPKPSMPKRAKRDTHK